MHTAAKKENKKITVSKVDMGFAALFDSVGSSLQIISLLLIPASVNQMLRGGVIIFTCILSKIFLGRKVHSHHLLGVFMCVVGFIFVGISTVLASNSSSASNATVGGTIAGLIMVIASLLVQSTQFVYEEVLLNKYNVPPQRMVGIEGMYGLVFIFMWMMIFTYIKCPSPQMCDVNNF
jgi:drug/metabolite transporter (DMT)-like permease